MQQAYEYVTFGEVQRFKYQWWMEHGHGIDFQDVLQSMEKDGQTHFDIPKKPDFLSWDLESMELFRSLTDQIPIPLEEEKDMRKRIDDQIVFLEVTKAVHIGLESMYAQELLCSMSYFTVLYVLSGKCELHLPDRTMQMKKGELCILPPDLPFYAITTPGDVVINISSDRDHFEEQFHALLFQDNPVSVFFRRALFEQSKNALFFMIPPTKDFKGIIQHLFHEFVTRDTCSPIIIYDLVQILYANIIRSSQNTLDYYENKAGNSITTLMPAILEYLEDNYQDITLERLADQFHYDPAYLSREIKSHTGSNFAVILASLKLAEAARLLSESRLSIASIAKRVGYNTASHFCVAFKKKYDISASAYRKQKMSIN